MTTRPYVLRLQKLRKVNQDIKHYQKMIEKHLNIVMKLQGEREELLKE